MIDIDSLDYTGNKPEVFFWYRNIAMSAYLGPGVIKPVVIKGTAEGAEVDVNFHEYDKLQQAINRFMESGKSP